jgi:hypothetical protein
VNVVIEGVVLVVLEEELLLLELSEELLLLEEELLLLELSEELLLLEEELLLLELSDFSNTTKSDFVTPTAMVPDWP